MVQDHKAATSVFKFLSLLAALVQDEEGEPRREGWGKATQFFEHVASASITRCSSFFLFAMRRTIYNFLLSQTSTSNGLTLPVVAARFVSSFHGPAVCPAVTDAFLAGE